MVPYLKLYIIISIVGLSISNLLQGPPSITLNAKCAYFTRCSKPRKAARQVGLDVFQCMVFLINKHP